MASLFWLLFSTFRTSLRSRAALQAEILSLHHSASGAAAFCPWPSTSLAGRRSYLLGLLSRLWQGWRSRACIFKPDTILSWGRKGFRLYWTWKSRARTGRPCTSRDIRDLIRKMSLANPRWGALRIHGELMKLGIDIRETTVAKYLVRPHGPSSQTWKTFLANHMQDLVSTDLFVVPTVTFRLPFVFLVLSHDRRRVIRSAVTSHPTAEFSSQQLRHAFPCDTAPRYLLRDRDSCYGEEFHSTTCSMGIHEVLTAPRSPWQNAYVERLIGSIRRECLDHVLIFNERGLRRILRSYFDYYEKSRTHLGLAKDAPISRPSNRLRLGK